MKFLVILALLLTFSGFVSCNVEESSQNDETTCTSSEETDTGAKESNTDAKESNADEYIVEEPSTLLTNYSDYGEYLETNAKLLPDDFVAYGELKALGEFVDFVLPVKGDHSYYLYSLKDSTGFLITVAITHNNTSKDVSIKQDSIVLLNKPSDLISTNDYRTQNIVFNNIRYSYDADGNLVYVTTQVEDVTITFSPGSVFVPDDSESSGKFVRMRFTDYKAERENILTCLLAGNEEEKDLASFLK